MIFFWFKNKNAYQLPVFKQTLFASISFAHLHFPVLMILDFMELGYWDP